MIEIRYTKPNPQGGTLKGVMRVIGKDIFLLTTDNPYTQQVISNLVAKKAIVTRDARNRWIKADIFSGHNSTVFKLGNVEFDISQTTDIEVENILGEFYYTNFVKAGFKCELIK